MDGMRDDAGADKSSVVPALSFRWATRFYDPVVRLTVRDATVKNALIDAALSGSERTVLDIGAGTGTLAIGLRSRGSGLLVAALDADQEILQFARKKANASGTDIDLIAGFSDRIPIVSGSVDLAVSSFFFHHITNTERARTFAEILRVLRAGGRLFFADFGKPADALQAVLSLPIRIGDGWKRTLDNFRGNLTGDLERAGFAETGELGHFRTMLGTVRLCSATKAE
ncbi:MAG TPA: class I SAM-dependent methyltransferase [Aridibacter sp.]|nr:class I SAM-dependent methyltransferase [Aridibacter sp.]